MARHFWWPGRIPEQMALMLNFVVKIGEYKTRLGLTDEQVEEAIRICNAFIAIAEAVNLSKSAMGALTTWRNIALYGPSENITISQAPTFPVMPDFNEAIGLFDQFAKIRERIMVSPGYTTSIGIDLKLVAGVRSKAIPEDLTPNLKATVTDGNTINLTGKMHGMQAVRIEYGPRGGKFSTVAVLTNLPATFKLHTAEPGKLEAGSIRSIFQKRNKDVGKFSANQPIVIS